MQTWVKRTRNSTFLRVERGKGKKDRHAQLSPVLSDTLRHWWREGQPELLGEFTGNIQRRILMTTHAVVHPVQDKLAVCTPGVHQCPAPLSEVRWECAQQCGGGIRAHAGAFVAATRHSAHASSTWMQRGQFEGSDGTRVNRINAVIALLFRACCDAVGQR